MLNVISQIVATGLTLAAFGSLIAWGKRDARERRERERQARKRAWEREIERAGRRMMEQDRIQKILRENVEPGEPPLRKVTGLFCGDDAKKFIEYKR